MKITYNSHNIVFSGEDLLEQSLLSECLDASKIDTKKGLTLHQYIKGEKTFKQEVAFNALSDWGLEPSTGVEKVNEMLIALQRRHRLDVRSVEEVMTTPEFAKRHNYQCPLCGHSIANGEEGLEIHHITPRIHGGQGDYKNLWLVHTSCHIDHHRKHPAKGPIPSTDTLLQDKKDRGKRKALME